jgi:hypothetical protein
VAELRHTVGASDEGEATTKRVVVSVVVGALVIGALDSVSDDADGVVEVRW